MLKIRDNIALALTKLKSRKIWTSFFVLIETVLLSTLLIAVSAFGGISKSLETFSNEGLSGRYLVTATNWRNIDEVRKNKKIWDLADELYEKYTAEHAVIAKEMGIPYSKDSEEKPTEYVDGVRNFTAWSKYGNMAIEDFMRGRLEAGEDELKEILKKYDYKNIYHQDYLRKSTSVMPLINGVEDLTEYKKGGDGGGRDLEHVFNRSSMHVVDKELISYYLFDDDYMEGDMIPVIMSLEQMEFYFNDRLEVGASDKEKLEHFEKIKNRSKKLKISACLRNRASEQLIFDAVTVNKEIDRNKNNSTYVEPDLIYGLPTEPCGAAPVLKDKRSTKQKAEEATYQKYRERIGEVMEEAQQEILEFKVVGLIRNTKWKASSSVYSLWDMFKSLGGVSFDTPIIPSDYHEKYEKRINNFFEKETKREREFSGAVPPIYIVEFNDAEMARNFIKNENCANEDEIEDETRYCATGAKPFMLFSNNNSSIIITDIMNNLYKMFLVALAVVLAITMLSMGKTVARSIAGDRKEIAIFRSIGLRRQHIMGVYLSYAAMLALIIAVVSLVLTLLVALVLNPLLSDLATDFLRVAFSTTDQSLRANIFSPNILYLLGLCGVLFVASLLSALLPIVINSRRNIVEGLKSE